MAESLAISYAATGELVPLFTRMLELCQVKPDEQVLLYTDSSTSLTIRPRLWGPP